MKRRNKKQKLADTIAQHALSLNPFPGRSNGHRQLVTRHCTAIADVTIKRLAETGTQCPRWLPETQVTPSSEQYYLDNIDRYRGAAQDEYRYITQFHNPKQKATNRVRAATWYQNDNQETYMTMFIIVSPLPCKVWGALPLTMLQWQTLMPALIGSHMHWTWVHAVRDYWKDDSYEVRHLVGWHFEKCLKLQKRESLLCTGQAIYCQTIDQFLKHELET